MTSAAGKAWWFPPEEKGEQEEEEEEEKEKEEEEEEGHGPFRRSGNAAMGTWQRNVGGVWRSEVSHLLSMATVLWLLMSLK